MLKKSILIAIAALASGMAFADVAVIVNPSNGNAFDEAAIQRIFLGKTGRFPDGSEAIPVNLEASAVREEFDSNILGRSSSQIKALWSKLIFTGKGTPPKEVATDADVVALVSKNPNVIGYVDAASVTGDVKVVATR